MSICDLMQEILDMTGYIEDLKSEGDIEAETRIENIDELMNKIAAYEESCEDEMPTLSGFLEEVALVADIDSLDEDSDYVVLMTLHSAKGLEFPEVYLAGMEDGLFPSYMTITSDDPTEVEEERRLCYVGITRARENLTLTCARRRMVRGETQYNKMSRFLKEIPVNSFKHRQISFEKDEKEVPKQKCIYAGKTSIPHTGICYAETEAAVYSTQGEGLSYDVGDRVRHMKFGEGLVTGITEGGRDYEVTVQFDTAGVKKMFATFAKLQKV